MRLNFLSRFLTMLVTLTGCMSFNSIKFDLFDPPSKEPPEVVFWSDADTLNKIALIHIEGAIHSQRSSDGGVTPADVEGWLSRIMGDPLIKGVVFQINSPGGAASSSEELFRIIKRFKQQRKIPVVSYVSDMAASGGYYLAQATDWIVVNPNALVGSVGVISTFVSAQSLVEKKLELKVVTVKSGAMKDSGSFFRDMSKEEINYWQTLNERYFERFLEVVAEGRKQSLEKIKPYADGRVFHPSEALKAGLIDEVGGFEEVLRKVKNLTKLDRIKVVRFSKKRSPFEGFLQCEVTLRSFRSLKRTASLLGARS